MKYEPALHRRRRDGSMRRTPRRERRPTFRLRDWRTYMRAFQANPMALRRLYALVAMCVIAPLLAPFWYGEEFPHSAQADKANTPMPFEVAGMSFPGSAFFYIDAQSEDAQLDDARAEALFDISGTGDVRKIEDLLAQRAGPSAKSFAARMSPADYPRALDCLAKAVYYEAASEPLSGQRAVAQVVLNRVAHPSFPNSVCGVVFQGSQRSTGCQFSFTCDGSLRRTPSLAAWDRAREIARAALSGFVYAPIGLATHYHTIWIYPYWAPSLDSVGTIGAHRFYRWKGNAGRIDAFISSYRGGEYEPPVNLGRVARNISFGTDEADPLTLMRNFEAARMRAAEEAGFGFGTREINPIGIPKTAENTNPHAAPQYADDIQKRGGEALFTSNTLPQQSTVKPEYANSGRWLKEPGKTTSNP